MKQPPPPSSASPPPAAGVPEFVVTGFGVFCGVPHNPTEALVRWLRDQPHHTHNSRGFRVRSCSVLEVSAAAVDAFLEQQRKELLREAAAGADDGVDADDDAGGDGGGDGSVSDTNGNDASAAAPAAAAPPPPPLPPLVLLHLGVDVQRPTLNLERQAFNNATFRCPDQAGWQPTAALIEPAAAATAAGGLAGARATALPLPQLAAELRDAGFSGAQVSADAGRFVCNYTFFQSLRLAAELTAAGGSGSGEQPQQQWRPGVAGLAKAAAVAAAAAAVAGGDTSSASTLTGQQQRQRPAAAAAHAGSSSAGRNGNGGASTSSSGSDGGGHGGGDSSDHSAAPAAAAAINVPARCLGRRRRRVYSLFVHVPLFAAVSEQQQRAFLMTLLERIATHVAGMGDEAGEGGGALSVQPAVAAGSGEQATAAPAAAAALAAA